MNFDFGDVLSRAWKITWKDKVLWIISILFGLSMSVIFPLMFSPVLFPLLMQNSRMDVSSVSAYLVGFIILFVLWIAALIPLFAVVMGLSMLFTKSAWVLTYLRLTRSSTSQPLLGSVEAAA